MAAGSRLGPYEILSPLGAGGMGEVYRARDTRLDRTVALKVLPVEVAADAERLRRFEKEARSASSLNHPAIVTIYEIGREGSTSFIAMELVAGKTLRELLFAGPLPVRRLLTVGAQVADGLAKAHAAGIVHRDLKPENVMVTDDGFAKILDFGLAKLTRPEPESGQETNAPTVSAGTEPGVVMGTVGYMSPEQATGRLLDFRSDQFSLGSVLYEMATGERAFSGKTKPEILAAIIRDDPESIGAVNSKIPPPVRWIVERCMAKEPRERYASTEDLARDLANVRDHLSEATLSGAALVASAPRARWRLSAALMLLVMAAAAAGLWAGKRIGLRPVPTFRQLTFRHGGIQLARFAPDGTVVYGAEWDGKPSELFTTRPGNPESRSLGLPPASIFSISSSGEMALRLGADFVGTLARAPLAGGAPRQVLEGVVAADWTPDGRALAVLRQVGDKRRLELPMGKVLYEGRIPWSPRVSPRGDRIAFQEGSQISIVDLSGKKTDLVRERYIDGLAWSPDGEIWYAAAEGGNSTIRAVTPGGRRRQLYAMPGNFILDDIGPDGQLLLERDSMSYEIVGMTAGEPRERSLSWLDQSRVADLSSDGKTLLINETGAGSGADSAVYIRGMDGSPAVRLGEGIGLALSPDVKWVLTLQSGRAVLLPTGAGEARIWPSGAIQFRDAGAFFPDGTRVLLAGAEPGHSSRLYILDVAGGLPRPITPEGVSHVPPGEGSGVAFGWNPISPDGALIASRDADGRWFLYPADGSGVSPRPVSGIGSHEAILRWAVDGKSVFVRRKDPTNAVFRLDLSSGRKTPWREFLPAGLGSGQVLGIVLTSDGKSYAYGYTRYHSDLFVLEGLK
ncbi:MAG TPA: protein kinase [Thermoanaerobaculia bacterium]|nr:protein kinase [Thermoanaerobaculia bacterium]